MNQPAKDTPTNTDRDALLEGIRTSVTTQGFGCHYRPIGDKLHLICSVIAEDGRHISPSFFVSLSSRGEWFLATWNDDFWIIPSIDHVVDVILECYEHMDGCMNMPASVAEKYSLIQAIGCEDDDVLDILYSQ